MFESEKKRKLTDLIDVEFLQEFQDFFAETMGVASIAVDDKGPITKPSNFSDFCSKFMRGSALGQKRCNECDIRWGRLAAVRGEPVIYTCHAGLTDFTVPIMIGDTHVASIIGGQVLTEPPNEEHFRQVAKELGINEDEYIEALRKIKIIPIEKVNAAAHLLYFVANSISKLAYKNLELIEKSEREELYRSIVETIRTTPDVDMTRQKIVEIIGKTLDADRCFIMEYDKKKDKFLPVTDEYLSSSGISSYKGTEANKDVPNFAKALKKGKNIVVDEKKIYVGLESDSFDKEREAIERLAVNAAFAIPLYYADEFLGALALHYVRKKHRIVDDELALLNTVANQISITMHQAKLYKATQVNASREKLIGTIIAKSVKTFDANQIKQIVKDVGIMTKADRCYFIEFDSEKMEGRPIDYDGEYLASPDIKSIIGYEFDPSDVSMFVEHYLKTRDLFVFDYELMRKESKAQHEGANKYSKLFDLKSGIGIPFFYRDKLNAVLVIEYVKEKIFPSDDELNFLRILGNQAGMAYNQIQLYLNTKKIAEREKLLKDVVIMIRSSIDINELKKNVVNEVGKVFNADRCYFRYYDKKQNEFLAPDVEYLSSNEIPSLLNEIPNQDGLAYFFNELLKRKKGFYPIFADEKFAYGTPLEKYFKSAGIKADYAMPIFDKDDELTYLVLHYTKKDPKLNEEDKKLLEIIANQIVTALDHAKLFAKTKGQAERESLLRGIIERIRSSLDIDETLSFICKETAKLFNVQRTAVTVFRGPKNYEDVILKAEYISSPEIKGFDQMENFQKASEYWENNLLTTSQVVAVDNIKESNAPAEFKSNYDALGVKAIMGTHIRQNGCAVGLLVLSEYNNPRHWSEEEKTLFKSVADQTYIAINQAELFAKEKENAIRERKSAERELLLRNIFETFRSSLDIDVIKHSMVTEVGKALKSNRCIIMLYDPLEESFYVDEHSEYRSSPDEGSFIGFDAKDRRIKWFMDWFKKGQELIIENVSEFIIKNKLQDLPEAKLVQGEDYHIKSHYSLPINYAGKLLGYVILSYTENYRVLDVNDIDFVRIIATQAGIAIHQAHLYKETQIQAERERINKNIIEILRSSLDKGTIKHLFVRNIGKYFNADRVFFADYDSKNAKYLPVDKNSEYLSSDKEKSFVGYDWSNSSVSEYIQPLLEKRELKIPCWDDPHNPPKSQGYISRFKDANVKSSYNLPVLYQQKMMGYFCIEFTQKDCKKLPEEDINRIRSMCTQAGMALYHADLLIRAQETAQEKTEFIVKVADKFKSSLNKIVESSDSLSTSELTSEGQVEYVNEINSNAKQLLDLTNEVIDISKMNQ